MDFSRRKPSLGLMDVAAAAEALGCTERMVRKLQYERQIPHVKVGTLVRFRPEAIAQYIDQNTVEAAQ